MITEKVRKGLKNIKEERISLKILSLETHTGSTSLGLTARRGSACWEAQRLRVRAEGRGERGQGGSGASWEQGKPMPE